MITAGTSGRLKPNQARSLIEPDPRHIPDRDLQLLNVLIHRLLKSMHKAHSDPAFSLHQWRRCYPIIFSDSERESSLGLQFASGEDFISLLTVIIDDLGRIGLISASA